MTTTKRPNDNNMTPQSSRSKNSRFGADVIRETVGELQRDIQALLDKNPSDPLAMKIQAGFEKLGAVLQAVAGAETAEEKERKRSLVIIGLPEAESGDSIERADSDSKSVVGMLRALEIQARPDKVYRMGRFDNNNGSKGPRLVKVVLPASTFQWQVLGALKTRRQLLRAVPGFEKAFVRPSLSKEELEADKALRARLKQYREESPGIKIYIKNGQIVAEGQGQKTFQ